MQKNGLRQLFACPLRNKEAKEVNKYETILPKKIVMKDSGCIKQFEMWRQEECGCAMTKEAWAELQKKLED